LKFLFYFFEFLYIFFDYLFIFLKTFKKIKIFITCQVDVMPRGSDSLMWQWQCLVSLLCRCYFFILNLVLVFLFLSQF